MARRGISEEEQAICIRVRIWRESLKLTRPEIFKITGISTERLAHIESGRAPLRYDVAQKMAAVARMDPFWIATGIRFVGHNLPQLPRAEDIEVPPRALFSWVFERKLLPLWNISFDAPELKKRSQFAHGDSIKKTAAAWVKSQVDRWFDLIPPDRIDLLVRKLIEAGDSISQKEQAVWEAHFQAGGSMRIDRNTSTVERVIRDSGQPPANSIELTQTTGTSSSFPPYENPTTDMQKLNLGQRIKNARESAGLTQEAAAQEWNISLGTLRDWEQNRTQPRGLYRDRIAEILSAIEHP